MHSRVPGRRRPWAMLLSALMRLAGSHAELLRHIERPWASVTFTGTRHTVTLAFAGAGGIAAAETFIAALPEHEFAIPRQIVADAAVIAADQAMLPEPRMTLEVDLLLVEDA